MLIQLLACLAFALPSAAQERADADGLIEQAWAFLPAYEGTPRFLLNAQVERETQAGAHLLQAGLALNPDHVRGLWSLGHALSLLAENHRNRGRSARANADYAGAVEALGHAIELSPLDAWSPYARAMAHTAAGEHALALADLRLTLGNALAAGESQDNMRFRAREWLPEVLMRLGKHEEAREALRRFHGEFASNSWPLLIALGESFQRQRDFAEARKVYQQTIQEYPNDFQAYALLGYLEGLSGNQAAAAQSMRLAIRNERFAGLYTRLWLWILATPELQGTALDDLSAFLKNPPDSVSAWDRSLGLFCIGELDFEGYAAALQGELQRRLELAEPLDDLECEAAFYRGLRLEREAQFQDVGDRSAARAAYLEALEARPLKWKWEWAYARLGLARCAAQDGLNPAHAPSTEESGNASWHRPGSDQLRHSAPEAWRVGDLLLRPGQPLQLIR